MRRVVLGVDADGRSYIAADDDLAPEGRVVLWDGDTQEMAPRIRAIDPATVEQGIEPSSGPGGLRWIRALIPSRSTVPGQGPTWQGMHTTRTIDCDYVLHGRVDCVADEGTVTLEVGDTIMIQGARHDWVNRGDDPAVLLVVLYSPV